jgi:very-short-patch-repair endonuclease
MRYLILDINIRCWAVARRIDFAYPDAMLAIEIDGFNSHFGKRAWQYDRARQNELAALGWTVVRFTWEDMRRRPSHVASLIRHFLSASGSPGERDVERRAKAATSRGGGP